LSEEENKLSTTALARKLDIPAQQLFATLKDYGWINRAEDSWFLTGKGEFEGGSYVDSRRYGRYIVWPDRLLQHPLLSAIESNKRISASAMRRYYPRLHPRLINRALAELGLQVHTVLGWELTDQGRRLHGQQEESENSGAFYVTWPHEIVDHPVIHRELQRLSDSGIESTVEVSAVADDLFAAAEADSCHQGVDGHGLDTALERQVCNWLYMAQLAHAYRRSLPVEEVLFADFYLPGARVYIECWELEEPHERLSLKLKKQDVYRDMKLQLVEVHARDIDRLDETLGRALQDLGIRV
jgi:hypothetical protein